MKNGYHIIDSHCHIYPEKIAARAILGTDSFYGVHSSENGTGAELIEKSEEYGVDRFVVQSVATTAKQVKSINEFIADEVEKSGGRFELPLGTLYPVLYRFVENGYISDRDEIVNKRLRKYYHLEEKGREFYSLLLGEYRKISEGVNMIVEGGGTDE